MRVLSVFLCLLGVASTRTVLQLAHDLQARTFASLVAKAGLSHELGTQGPFTIFAPTDDAFAKVPSDVMSKLSHDKDLLTKVIKYHVTAGSQLMKNFRNDIEIGSWANGYKIRINVYQNGQVMTATGSRISSRDNIASNGVVHLIDDVMYPLPEESVLQYCASNQNLTQLTYSFIRSNLQYDIQGGPFTVFAPTEAAFDALPTGFLNTEFLTLAASRTLLQYHYIQGTYYSAGLTDGMKIRTVQGSDVIIKKNNNGVMVENAKVIQADIKVTNGVVHIIDKVLLVANHVSGESEPHSIG
ncbi:periostin-like [Saccostrea echinata]|uniref:periostin-like n=1 Tax=Saccostrea echinata TaxID=191078 RepID=UPI002A7F476D|nr:periostin-like [Saccostrea echinata]